MIKDNAKCNIALGLHLLEWLLKTNIKLDSSLRYVHAMARIILVSSQYVIFQTAVGDITDMTVGRNAALTVRFLKSVIL